MNANTFHRRHAVFILSGITLPHRRLHFGVSCQSRSRFLGVHAGRPKRYVTRNAWHCALPTSEPTEKSTNEEDVPNNGYFVTYQSWRNPKWLELHRLQSQLVSPRRHPRNVKRWFCLPKKDIPLRLACSAALLTVLGLLSLSYVRLNHYVRRTIQVVASDGLNRELHVGRVVRCNPFTGLKLRDVSVPPSPQHPTAPVISAVNVDIGLSGFLRALFLQKPLRVNVHLDDAEVRVSQLVTDGPKGLPVGQWDPGIYPGGKQHEMDHIAIQGLSRVLRFLQPGALTVQNARVFLQPADFLDYGHGSEIVEVGNASAMVTFPQFTVCKELCKFPVAVDGDFKAHVKGKPVDGGWIEVEAELKGETLSDLKPEDEIVSLRVFGDGVKSNRVASFLSLPFRADDGVCGADISMDFLYKSKSLVPLMRGEAKLSAVSLRFHPDQTTPEFRNIDGKLRFEGKTLFLDGPVGELGTLPMTVVGNIHLEDGYSLMGYVRPVDVNNILDTFDVEKFVPVVGLVSGEAQLTGELEEPVVSGWAELVGDGGIFDRLPLKTASTTFEWDAIAGLLKFPEINASVKGGGSVFGTGCMYFDMTKDNEYGIRQPSHSPRSPKATYWNEDAKNSQTQGLPPLPEDELEIDEKAPFRPYDSMRFDFKVTNVNGGDLLDYYGGVYGKMATKAIGLVSGEGILAGHMKDANCRVTWKSTTPPPDVEVEPSPRSSLTAADVSADSSSRNAVRLENEQDGTGYRSAYLGGGDFRGLVYVKLGDLPEARRVKVRTIVEKLDARRCAWADPKLQRVLTHSPLLEASMDTYFKGVMFQRPVLLPGQTQNPRTPRMELLGADGALAVKNLNVNNVRFNNVMSGSFSFSTSDFSLSIKEVNRDHVDSKLSNRASRDDEMTEDEHGKDELTVAASLKGQGNFCFRLRDSEMIASVSKDEQNHQVAGLFARNVIIQDFMGKGRSLTSAETLAGTINADMKLDLTSRTGEGNVSVADPRVGPLNFSSVQGKVVWRDQDLFLESGTVKYRRSEYQLDGRYSYDDSEDPEFGWEVNVRIPRASIRDVAQLVSSANAVATTMQSPEDKLEQGRSKYSGGPAWIRRLSQSNGDDQSLLMEEWKVPEELVLTGQMEWFEQFLDEHKRIMRTQKLRNLDGPFYDRTRSFADVSGDLSGKVTVRYNSRIGENRVGPSNASAVLRAMLDQLTRTSFSFQLTGDNWGVGPARVKKVQATGTFEDGILDVREVAFNGKDGFGVQAQGRITNAGSVRASAFLKRAPADLLKEYSRAPVHVTGECDGRLEIEGNLSNPRAFGRLVWTDATLNGKRVHEAKTDLACVNGRCILNSDAVIGGRKTPTQIANDLAAIQSLNWGETVVAGLQDLASQVSSKGESYIPMLRRSERKGSGEALQVRISAPVRFYLLNYLRRRAPQSFWSELEPVLGGSLPSDDEWILMDVDVKKYGLILLNTALPELGWDSGDSDVRLRVSGTLKDPIVNGRVSVSDGRLSPLVLAEPLQSLRGEVHFTENGLMSCRSISGRCGGKTVSLNGDIFISEDHQDRLTKTSLNNQAALDSLKPHDAQTRRARRLLLSNQKEVKAALDRGSRGLALDFGEFPINVNNTLLSKLSGKLRAKGTVLEPELSGSLTLADGVIFLANTSTYVTPKSKSAALAEALRMKSSQYQRKGGNFTNVTVAGANMIPGTKRATNRIGDFSESEGQNVVLNGLQLNLGRGMQVVQPFVLNLDTTGSLRINGSSLKPEVCGEVKLLSGNVNVLATRMSIRKEESNYVKFEESGGDGTGEKAMPEPLIQIALEDKDLLVRIPECSISSWSNNLEVSDKSGVQISPSAVSRLLDERLEGIRNREAMQRLLAGYAVKAVAVGGKGGGFEWRLYPDLVSRAGGIIEGRLKDELGAGATVEFGGMSLSSSASVGGTQSNKLSLRLWDWLGLEFGNEGLKTTSEFKLKVPTFRGRDTDEKSKHTEGRNESTAAGDNDDEPPSQPLQSDVEDSEDEYSGRSESRSTEPPKHGRNAKNATDSSSSSDVAKQSNAPSPDGND